MNANTIKIDVVDMENSASVALWEIQAIEAAQNLDRRDWISEVMESSGASHQDASILHEAALAYADAGPESDLNTFPDADWLNYCVCQNPYDAWNHVASSVLYRAHQESR